MANELYHHGIKGQKWGVTNGPPYPLNDEVSTGKRLKSVAPDGRYYTDDKDLAELHPKQYVYDAKILKKSKREKEQKEPKNRPLKKSEATKRAKELSEEDLKKEIDRLNLEKRYVDLNKDLSRKERTDGILSRYGGQILGTAIGIATAYAVNKVLNETVDAKIEKRKEKKERAEIERKREELKKYSYKELQEINNRRAEENKYLGISGKNKKKR